MPQTPGLRSSDEQAASRLGHRLTTSLAGLVDVRAKADAVYLSLLASEDTDDRVDLDFTAARAAVAAFRLDCPGHRIVAVGIARGAVVRSSVVYALHLIVFVILGTVVDRLEIRGAYMGLPAWLGGYGLMAIPCPAASRLHELVVSAEPGTAVAFRQVAMRVVGPCTRSVRTWGVALLDPGCLPGLRQLQIQDARRLAPRDLTAWLDAWGSQATTQPLDCLSLDASDGNLCVEHVRLPPCAVNQTTALVIGIPVALVAGSAVHSLVNPCHPGSLPSLIPTLNLVCEPEAAWDSALVSFHFDAHAWRPPPGHGTASLLVAGFRSDTGLRATALFRYWPSLVAATCAIHGHTYLNLSARPSLATTRQIALAARAAHPVYVPPPADSDRALLVLLVGIMTMLGRAAPTLVMQRLYLYLTLLQLPERYPYLC